MSDRFDLHSRSDQIGLSLPSPPCPPPRASACGMGIVHMFLTQEVEMCTARGISL